MPLYIAIDATTKQQRRLSSVQAADVEPLAADEALVQIDEFDTEPVGTHRWDANTISYAPVPGAVATPRTVMSKGDWMADRLGLANEIALHAIRIDPAQPILVRAQLEALLAELARREFVDVQHPSTQLAAPMVTDVLIAAGRVQAADRDAFIAQLLAPREE